MAYPAGGGRGEIMAAQRASQSRGSAARGQARTDGARTASGTDKGAPTAQDAAATVTPAHSVTITIPLDRAIDVAMVPVAAAGRLLSARRGLPVYAGLGVLAVADIIDLPVAAAAGVGYAALRRWGPLRPGADREQQAQRAGPSPAGGRPSSGNGEDG